MDRDLYDDEHSLPVYSDANHHYYAVMPENKKEFFRTDGAPSGRFCNLNDSSVWIDEDLRGYSKC